LILSVPSAKEEKSVPVEFGTDANCSFAIVPVQVPNTFQNEQHADFRDFAMVKVIRN
jgi:hypothetical protein